MAMRKTKCEQSGLHIQNYLRRCYFVSIILWERVKGEDLGGGGGGRSHYMTVFLSYLGSTY